MIQLIYDTELKRPACVLIQAAAGCNQHDLYRLGFDSKSWLTFPTPGMKRISGTEEEWRRVAKCGEQDATAGAKATERQDAA